MGLFNVVFLAVFLVITCGASFSKVPGAAASLPRHCRTASECRCQLGFPVCFMGICGCDVSFPKVPEAAASLSPRCGTASDCKPSQNCIPLCINGVCSCWEGQKESIREDNSDLSCFKSPNCHTRCPPEWVKKCVDGKCMCTPHN